VQIIYDRKHRSGKTRLEFGLVFLIYVKKSDKNGKLTEKKSTCQSFLFLNKKNKSERNYLGFVLLDNY